MLTCGSTLARYPCFSQFSEFDMLLKRTFHRVFSVICDLLWKSLLRLGYRNVWIFLIVSVFHNSSAQETDLKVHREVEAIAGGHSLLPCDFTSKRSDIALVLWYKGSAGIPIYTLDARNFTSLAYSLHSPSNLYRNRAHLNIQHNSIQLQLKKVAISDAGEYRCRVDFRNSPTEDYLVNLTVIEPPVSLTVWNTATDEKVEGIIGPYNQGTNLSLRCTVIGGQPRPWINWYRGSDKLETLVEKVSDQETTSDVVIFNLSRSDLMAKLTCKTGNSKLGDPLEVSLSVNLNLMPVSISLEAPKQPLVAGSKVEMVCVVSGSRPAAKIHWWLEGQRLTRARETTPSEGNETLSVLAFSVSPGDHQKELICHAENTAMNNASLEAKTLLNIHYAPLTRIVLGDKIDGSSIREGSDVYFECIVDSNPWVIEVNWLFDGSPLSSKPSSGIIISNQSLVLQKVKRENRGLYSCSATNYLGVGRSDKFRLKVLYAPVCRPGQLSRYGVAPNEQVNITCDLDSDPEQVSFNWLLNNSRETIKIRHFASNGSQSVAFYTPRYSDGYGKLLCFGSNRVGDQREPCIFSIVLASPPDSVTSCRVTNQTVDSLLVICKPGDGGGLKQIFFLEVYNTEMQKLHWSTASEVPSFHIQSLPSSTRFDLNIYAENKKGRSPSYSLSTFTLNLPQKAAKKHENQASSLQPIIGILIGIILTSLLIMSAIIMCIKRRSHVSLASKNHFTYITNSPSLRKSNLDSSKKLPNKPTQMKESNQDPKRSSQTTPISPVGFSSTGYCHKNIAGDRLRHTSQLEYAELSLIPRETWHEMHQTSVGLTEYASIDFHLTKQGITEISREEALKAGLLLHKDYPQDPTAYVQTSILDHQINIH